MKNLRCTGWPTRSATAERGCEKGGSTQGVVGCSWEDRFRATSITDVRRRTSDLTEEKISERDWRRGVMVPSVRGYASRCTSWRSGRRRRGQYGAPLCWTADCRRCAEFWTQSFSEPADEEEERARDQASLSVHLFSGGTPAAPRGDGVREPGDEAMRTSSTTSNIPRWGDPA